MVMNMQPKNRIVDLPAATRYDFGGTESRKVLLRTRAMRMASSLAEAFVPR